jgi:hypothetical protein
MWWITWFGSWAKCSKGDLSGDGNEYPRWQLAVMLPRASGHRIRPRLRELVAQPIRWSRVLLTSS